MNNDSMEFMQEQVGSWADSTFVHTEQGITLHLLREAAELSRAIGLSEEEAIKQVQYEYAKANVPERVDEEAADVCILLLALAYHMRFSLGKAVDMKHLVNKGRTWGKPDAHGVTEHSAA